LGAARFGKDARVRLLGISAALTFFGYFFVGFDQGHGWGYRYFHSAWGVVPIFAGCAMAGKSRSCSKFVSFAGVTAILSLLMIVPFQLSQIQSFISQHLAQLASPERPGNNVYFVRPQGGYYAADMIQFDPMLRNRDLFLVSHGTVLDSLLVTQNWPGAVKVSSSRAGDQWYLGPEDQRVPISASSSQKQFVIAHIPR
jgi:hypothetical protein